ncbi:PP0621 family protein [Variovorax sp. JS1663]|uniref:PP0621 family protein n=1 Tax=Variovorax sp. JS1663 TaxID=1851577 RepID=UPI000513E670|nr:MULTISPECIES: PP0621 family protein [Burkholderiales]KGF78016.1 hypothetical protein IA69_33155 [Massilia sp. JS1662]OUM02309.1 hypothetical protein A8M77_11525 [Variovorax sp. JS1663]
MKYLLVLIVVLVAVWLWRKGRREELQSRKAPPRAPREIAPPQAMLRCAHCGLHLPAAEAVRAADGTAYCSGAHRQAATH